MEQDPYFIQHAQAHGRFAGRVRWRARFDMLLVATVTAGGAFLGSSSHDALMSGAAALSLGILYYVIRRDRDLVALAARGRWREQALEGRGVAIGQWREGAALEPWERRRTAAGAQPLTPRDSDSPDACG